MILRYLIKTVTIINQSSCGTEIYLDLRVHWKIKINIQSFRHCDFNDFTNFTRLYNKWKCAFSCKDKDIIFYIISHSEIQNKYRTYILTCIALNVTFMCPDAWLTSWINKHHIIIKKNHSYSINASERY